jgi:hypothetical protein
MVAVGSPRRFSKAFVQEKHPAFTQTAIEKNFTNLS